MAFKFSISIGGKKKKKSESLPAPSESLQTEPQILVSEQELPLGVNPEQERILTELIKKVFLEEEAHYAKLGNGFEMPITAGRSSIYEGARNFGLNDNTPVPTNFDFNHLRTLQQLSMFNRHVSMAVENIVSLGNTDYEIDFGDGIGSKQATEMRKYLWSEVKNWYEFADGEESLDNDLLVQLATYGTISAEACITKNLGGIQKIVRVDPYYIRFGHDKKKDVHIPLQQVGGVIAATTGKYPGYIELNTSTYNYIAMRRIGEMPYAVPPFLSALEDLFTENDMIKNFQNMMRRMGMLGFMSVLVTAPAYIQGESATTYQNRLSAYLESMRGPAERGYSRGVALGFKGTHEFKVEGANLNSGNADNLMRMIKSLVFSGLKQDPNMHGENYATTETFGRVILEKMTAQVSNFQKPLGTFKARIFSLALLLKGYRFNELIVKYNKPSTFDEEREQTVRKLKQDNLRADYEDGLIDQPTRARMLGYDKPSEKEPRLSHEQKLAEKTIGLKAKQTKKFNKLKKKLRAIPEFNYSVPANCNTLSFETSKDDPGLIALVIAYLHTLQGLYSSVIESSITTLINELSKLSKSNSVESVQSTLISNLMMQWEEKFLPSVSKKVNKNVSDIYAKFRRDKAIFKDKKEIPSALITGFDARAIDFLEEMDKAYLAKFLGDSDTQTRLNKWIKEQFDAGKIPLEGSRSDMRKFMSDFSDVIEKESWKIDRIVNTSTVMAKNIASMSYLNQAGIEEYQVVEVMDEKTCRYCQHMNGMTFSVNKTMEQYDEMFTNGIESLNKFKPFATKFKIDEFEKLDETTLFSLGIALPPYHPNCRGQVVSTSN